MKKYLSLLLAILLIFSLSACGNVTDKDTNDSESTAAADSADEKDTVKELYTLGDFVIEYKGAKIASDDRGYEAVIITLGFTNNSDSEATCSDNLYTRAEQNGELMSYSSLSADEYYKKTAAPGETIDVTFGYLLNPLDWDGNINFTDAVTLTVNNPIAEADCTITIDPTTLTNEISTDSNT